MIQAQHVKTDYYKKGSYEYGGVTLPYRQLDLNQEQDGLSMLVLLLHGGTSRGDDNVAQLAALAVDSIEVYLRVHGCKATFLLPQCGKDRLWNESVASQPVPMTEVLDRWLCDFLTNHDIDTTRIYIMGYSAGGSGAWRMVNDYRHTFAAACIAAANPVMVQAANVMLTPVYAVAGSEDNIMDAGKIETFVKDLRAMGGEARFDLLEGRDHFATCDEAFNRHRLAWTFGHTRGTSGVSELIEPRGRKVTGVYAIDGRPVAADASGLLIVRYDDGSSDKVIR